MTRSQRRVGIFGWGVVAPKSRDIAAFARNLESDETWLTPFNGFGPDNFLVGVPDFDLTDYAGWINERFPPSRISQIERKMGTPTQYAIGAFIQSLAQNPGIEQVLQDLGSRAHVYVGTGLGDLPTFYEWSVRLHDAQRDWNHFWSNPEQNGALRAFLDGSEPHPDAPPDPATVTGSGRAAAGNAWQEYWTARSPQLHDYLKKLREIESLSVEGEIESAKAALIRKKQGLIRKLQQDWGAPAAPWTQVSANVLWNIHSAPASQISMLGKITGMTFAPVAACSTFGYTLKLAMNAIQLGEAEAVVIGAADPCPHPLTVGCFVQARVISADGDVSKPLTGMRGTHVSGGSVVWIIGDYEAMTARGFEPLGMEPVGMGVNADANHIITPTPEGPTECIEEALAQAGVDPSAIGTWDLHATATPGDFLEVDTARKILPENVLITARKGTFGHGMGVSGGWELLAQYLGYEYGKIYPTPLSRDELNAEISRVHQGFAYQDCATLPDKPAGKLSMGVGGINMALISRPWKK